MKKLLLVLMLLVGCSTTTKPRLNSYNCIVYVKQGTLAKINLKANTLEEANREADKAREKLVSEKMIPDYALSECYEALKEKSLDDKYDRLHY